MLDTASYSTLRSIDEAGRMVRWWGEYRSRIFLVVGTLAAGVVYYVLKDGVTSLHGSAKTTQDFLLYAMIGGSFLALLVDLGFSAKQKEALTVYKDGEELTNSEVKTWHLFKSNAIMELRFLVCYLFLMILGGTLLAAPYTNLLARPL